MNIMKKFVGHGRTPLADHVSQDNSLGLMHLRKLFAEFRHPSTGASQKDQEDKLYNMLPLFCKVFESCPSCDMTERFGDILQFCSHVSKLMVTEVRRRASNQSTVEASCAIVRFLEIESQESNGNGWTLLTSINLLSTGNTALIDCMTAASLPSTLVKCLYLFFDLPCMTNGDVVESGFDFSPKERKILLQKVFVQVLVRLTSHTSPAEELSRKDDLSLLFSAITSWCPPYNVPWRTSAAEVLVTLSRHGLTHNVVKYIHDKGCVRHCVENMQRVQELSPLELVEMFVTVFCFLKDSSEVSQTLMDDFRACQGYMFLSEFLLRLERDHSEEAQQALRNLVLLIGSLTTCGFIEIRPSPTSAGSLFHIPGFQVPQPAGKGVSVRNLQAFQVLQSVFLKDRTEEPILCGTGHMCGCVLGDQSVLRLAASSHLCSTILDVISSIYHQDSANYFILEPQHTLSQFAEKIHHKPAEIQQKFFELMEFVVFDLSFVPCKELVSLSILIKSHHSIECNILCIRTLLKIIRFHAMFKDAFREVGMLEVLVTCLHRYAALLKDPQNGNERPLISKADQELGYLVMEALSVLLSSNSSNANVFRECGGARCAHNMVPYAECRQQALSIVQQLVLSPGGDDDMGTLLGLMHTAPIEALELKTHILKSLLNVLRESHRTRTVFRKVGGFVYVMSVLVSMEGCLAEPPKAPWYTIARKSILTMLKTVFSTLTVAMRYEPANAKFFTTEVRYDSLTEAVRLLGCFAATVDITPSAEGATASDDQFVFEDVFSDSKAQLQLEKSVPVTLLSACTMIRYLYDMALDSFDKYASIGNILTLPSAPPNSTSSPSLKRISLGVENACSSSLSMDGLSPKHSPLNKRASTGSIGLDLNQGGHDLIIVHAGAVMSIFHLLPACDSSLNHQLTLDLQLHTAEVLKSLLRTERNQQQMCDVGFPHELLRHGNVPLADESHPLHPPLQYMFERLAAQSLTPRDLRDFLRLGSPLNCRPMDEKSKPETSILPVDGLIIRSSSMEENRTPYELEKKLKTARASVPFTRVKCLVSMTTPRDARLHGASVTPAFVEFDMSTEGFGCLYLPSIAPQGPPAPSVVSGVVSSSSEPIVIGGIGTGERIFPPQSGLTYSAWYCVDKFSSSGTDAHPVRLLTIVRNLQGRDENMICLSVTISSRERALFVSTLETPMPQSVIGQEYEQEPALNDNAVRFWCPELTQEGQWHHMVLIFHRAGIMKNGSVSLFINGAHINTQRLNYVSPNLGGGGTASPTAFTSVFAYIATPPQLRRQSRLMWRQGPCHMFEDIVSSTIVNTMYQLGPNYVGSFQAPILDDRDPLGALINEEKVVFGVHAHAASQMTVAKIRKVYNKVDSKSIAKLLAMSAHDNATPIRILHNSAGHLSGSARSLGAILMGYLGVRTFCPRPVAKVLENMGGASALLGLIAMATDVEGLYAAVKALVCVVRGSKSAIHEMDRIRGYQTLAMLYKKKRHLLNSHILHLTFSLVGTVDSGRESSMIPNRVAFEDVLCDLEVWHEAPGDLQRSLYEHYYELITESSDQKCNHSLMNEIGLVSRLLYILKAPLLSQSTIETIAGVLLVLLQGGPNARGLLRLGQFLVSTLSSSTTYNENSVDLAYAEPNEMIDLITRRNSSDYSSLDAAESAPSAYGVKLRNTCMEIILKLIYQSSNNNMLNQMKCDEVQRILGFDWLSLFMQDHVHKSTVILALRILTTLLRQSSTMNRFREGGTGGGWLANAESVLRNQSGVVLGFNIGGQHHQRGMTTSRDISMEVCRVPGFAALYWLLPKHTHVAEIYFLLMALLLGQHVRELPTDIQLNLDAVWTVIFGVPASKPVAIATGMEFCPDAAVILLCMTRTMLNQQLDDSSSWLQEYPVTLMQFFLFLYHNQSEFVPLCMTPDVLTALAATLFSFGGDNPDSDVTTPSEEFKPFPDSESVVIIRSLDRSPSTSLSSHPACKFVTDFLRMIIVDSLSQTQSTRSPSIIDLLLEVCPEGSTKGQRHEFVTNLLQSLMDHLLAADILVGEQAALPMILGGGGNYSNMATNVFYLATRIIDKLWQGVYTRDSKEVFEFISKLIVQAKRKASGLSLDPVYRCLNRTVLFQLSRSVDNVASQIGILDALHRLTSNRNLVFGPGNYDPEFLGCLCHCLLRLTDSPNKCFNDGRERQTTWHVIHDPDTHSAEVREGLKLVATASRRVWDELYICKKPALEELFKIPLNNIDCSSPTINITTPDLSDVRPIIQEAAHRMWMLYAENERKTVLMPTDRLPAQIQSKLQKVGSGVLKLARKTKKELPLKSSPVANVHYHDFILWSLTHASIVKDLVEMQYKQYVQSQEHMGKYLLEEWTMTEMELLRERGLWGPPHGSRLDKWMLDSTEGPCRMRKKMLRNDMFYRHYPYRPDMDSSPHRYKVAISFDSKDYYNRFRSQSIVGDEMLPLKISEATDLHSMPEADVEIYDEETNTTEITASMRKLLPGKQPILSCELDDDPDENLSESTNHDTDKTETNQSETSTDSQLETPTENKTDNQTILRILGDGEKISHMFRCARIQGLDTAEGLLLFGREHFYVIDGFTLLTSKEIRDIDTLPPDFHDPIIPKASKSSGSSQKRVCSKFAYEDIREVHKRRYLLQPIAVEVFSADGRNYLLAFPRQVRNKVYAKFLSVATAITDNAHQSVSGQRHNAKVEPGTGLISTLIGEKSVTQRWERGDINNFQYLMHLNTLAGRSYNDLMQYPVFPWIVADYDSEELDLYDPATFRDLTKPMGGQTQKRLLQFHKRYQDWDDPQGETPPYHYGTHYSSAMIVASYLLRLEPFTQHFLKLQGGHFDLADRMFHSVKENWLSAAQNNMADVKELIPEFFYLPELLTNSNNFDLGCKQSGVALCDVILPPWAKGDPREFIRAHREALESDFVSAHLHEWIDLIFGYKQRGQAAAESVNVFHHLFYEGNVDIYNIDDPLRKNAVIGFINNFGQIPKQLFKKPHPQKRLNSRILDPVSNITVSSNPAERLFFHSVDNLRPAMQPMKELKSAVGQIISTDKSLLAVEQNKVLMPPVYGRYLAWGFSDLSMRLGNYESEKAMAVFECMDYGEILCAACPNAKLFITGGTSCVVTVWEFLHKDKKVFLKQPLYGHTEPVTCLAASPSYNVIVSGSRDRTCILWDMSRLEFVRQLRGHTAPVAAVCVNELTGDIATCAGTYLYVWNINGDEIAAVNTATSRNQQILCVTMSQMMEWDSRNVILTGSSDGVVRMWSIEYVQVPDEHYVKTKKTASEESVTDGAHQSNSASRNTPTFSKPIKIPALQRQESCDSYDSPDRTAVERLKDFKDPDYVAAKRAELASSADSDSNISKYHRQGNFDDNRLDSMSSLFNDTCSLTDDKTSLQGDTNSLGNVSRDLTSTVDDTATKEEQVSIDPATDALIEFNDADSLVIVNPGAADSSDGASLSRQTESDTSQSAPIRNTSSSSDFEIISVKEIKEPVRTKSVDVIKKYRNPSAYLREGFKWQRQLLFRSKLTMHTAFERKDNKDPAAVTCIAVSKDHKSVYVGDAKGRIFSWTVTDQPGRVAADHWMKDDGVECCLACGTKFSFAERRHHCRNCGQVFCSKCSRFETEIRRLRIVKPVRVCQACYNILRAQQVSDAMSSRTNSTSSLS